MSVPAVPSADRLKPPAIKVAGGKVQPLGDDPEASRRFAEAVWRACGTQSAALAAALIEQLVNAQGRAMPSKEAQINGALAALAEHAPQNATEALLVTQMIACHAHYMELMAQASNSLDAERRDRCLHTAMKLARVFVTQATTLRKLRQKAQKISVEHVHVQVQDNAQAIVGCLDREGGRGGVYGP